MHGRVVDNTGQPRPGVAVSDGVTVTHTGSDGSFSLQPAGPFVFLTRPSGWSCPEWFVPSDRPEAEFVLTPAPEPIPYRFVHLSDTHVSTGEASHRLPYPEAVELGERSALANLLSTLPDRVADAHAVVITGDLTDTGLDADYAAVRSAVAGSPLPVHLLPGNHDHMGGEYERLVSRNNYKIHSGDPSGYERNIGPRWYSFDLPGLHVVALDWHTHEIGLDHEVQDAWLRADLECLLAGTPWILLCHDQPWWSILGDLPSRPVATFSGHRHASRVVEVDGTLHVNTPSALFAGLDYSPPSFRVVSWDGERISLSTQESSGSARAVESASGTGGPAATGRRSRRRTSGSVPWRWRHQLAGSGHRAPVRVTGDLVVAPVLVDDHAAGGVEALVLADGSLRWRAELESAVRAAPEVHGDVVLAVEVSGDLVCLGLDHGTELWRVPSPEPLRLFGLAEPVVADGLVITGDVSHLRAHDAVTGELRWERTGIVPYGTFLTQAAPVAVGDTLVIGAALACPTLVGLDLTTGRTRWPEVMAAGGGLTGGSPTPLGTPVYDEASRALYVAAVGRLARVDPAGGDVAWSAATNLPFSPATPVPTPDGIAAVDAGGALVLLDRDSGEPRWRTPLGSPGRAAMSSYRRAPHGLLAGPTLVGDLLVVPGLDGHLYAVEAGSGRPTGRIDVAVPVAAPVVAAAGLLLAVGVDGGVLAIDERRLA